MMRRERMALNAIIAMPFIAVVMVVLWALGVVK